MARGGSGIWGVVNAAIDKRVVGDSGPSGRLHERGAFEGVTASGIGPEDVSVRTRQILYTESGRRAGETAEGERIIVAASARIDFVDDHDQGCASRDRGGERNSAATCS